MPIEPEFLDLLVCPHPDCHEPLRQPADDRLVCTGCRRVYPVRDGFPVLLLDEAWIEGNDVHHRDIETQRRQEGEGTDG